MENSIEIKRPQKAILTGTAILLVLLTAFLHIFVRPGADDFYYSTFLDGTLSDFIHTMIEHHQTCTGRTFVHLVLCPLLEFDMIPFRIWNPIMIVVLCCIIAKLSTDSNKGGFVSMFVFSLSLFWLNGLSVLSGGLLWGAGSLNYFFPSFMIVFYGFLYNKALTKGSGWWVAGVGFLAAATVEMTGILAIVTVIYFSAVNFNETKNKKGYVFLNLICACFGYITLFLTAGIGNRLVENSFYSISHFERICTNIVFFSRKICDINGLGMLAIITLTLSALWLWKNGNKKMCVINFIVVILVLLGVANITYSPLTISLTALFMIFIVCVDALIFLKSGDRIYPFFALCIFVSLTVCAIAPVVGYRLLFPGGVFLVVMSCRALCEISKNIPFKTVVIIAAVAACFMIAFTVGFWKNAKVVDANSKVTKGVTEGEALVLQNVWDEVYGNCVVPTGLNFGFYYLRANNLKDETVITVSDNTKEILCEGNVVEEKAIVRRGVAYVPLRIARTVKNAEVRWRLAYAEVILGDSTYRFTLGAKTADLGYRSAIKLEHPVRIVNETTYISLMDFNKVFGTQIIVCE